MYIILKSFRIFKDLVTKLDALVCTRAKLSCWSRSSKFKTRQETRSFKNIGMRIKIFGRICLLVLPILGKKTLFTIDTFDLLQNQRV